MDGNDLAWRFSGITSAMARSFKLRSACRYI